MAGGDDPLLSAAQMIGGFHEVLPLRGAERAVMLDLVTARFVITVLITGWRAARYPENREYIMRNNGLAWAGLRRIMSVVDLFSVNAFIPGQVELDPHEARMVEQRTRLLGPAYRLMYQKPLHFVRGEGVWLYDADGRRYLDTYNNVVSLGHCHPDVVEAITRQVATLCTNTRYLHETILELAE
ncbi:hypothetical protein KXW38_010057, partial [Aspergillus fumigatus]